VWSLDGRATTLAPSPAGDFLLGNHDVEFISRFYQYNRNTKTWKKKWEKATARDYSQYFHGYYTADGDFCLFNEECLANRVPGPMTTKRLLTLIPEDNWNPFQAQGQDDSEDDLLEEQEAED